MEWTKTLPKIPGFYWHWTDTHNLPTTQDYTLWVDPMLEMITISRYAINYLGEQALFVESLHDYDHVPNELSEFKQSWHWWMGPISPPVPPESELVSKERLEYEQQKIERKANYEKYKVEEKAMLDRLNKIKKEK